MDFIDFKVCMFWLKEEKDRAMLESSKVGVSKCGHGDKIVPGFYTLSFAQSTLYHLTLGFGFYS